MVPGMQTGPTKNSSYNQCLADWARAGHACAPECEVCGCDLTDQDVFETDVDWRCAACEADYEPDFTTHAQEAREERRQMGLI